MAIFVLPTTLSLFTNRLFSEIDLKTDPLKHCASPITVLWLHEDYTWGSPAGAWLSNKQGEPKQDALAAAHRCPLAAEPDTGMEMEQRKQKRRQKTKTKTQQSHESRNSPAHLGIWLQSRHWSSGPPLLLYIFSIDKGREGRRAVIRQV